MAKADFICVQPIEGVPVVKYIYSDKHCVYSALSVPVAVKKISDNVSFAVFAGSKYGKLTITTEGSGDIRKNPSVTFEEISESEVQEILNGS